MAQLTLRWFAPLVLALAGCGGAGDTVGPTDPLLDEEGTQFRMVSTIAPGEEVERCQFFVVPPGGINLNRSRVRYLEGSHHVVLAATSYTSIPTVDRQGKQVDTSGVFDCSSGPLGSWDVTGIVALAQDPEGPDTEMPPGVAIRLPAGSIVLMNTHYLNASSEPLETDARINLYSIPDAEVKTEGGFLLFFNPFIRVPALGASSARMRCPVPSDVNIVSLASHMHRRGVHFSADLVDAEGSPEETLFETDQWTDVPTRQWLPGKSLPAGSAVDFRCAYENPESRVVAQGPTTRDEMCGLVGVYYPRDPAFEACSSAGLSDPGRDATWIGDGDLTCMQAVACAGAATDEASLYGCIVDSCPASGAPLSALLHCQLGAIRDADAPCGDVCQFGAAPSADCQSCILKTCGSQLAACAAASCE